MKTNRFSLSIVVILAASFLISCQKEDDSRTRADEIAELDKYLVENQILMQPTWTGLYYIENEEGTGAVPEYKDTVYINYTATSLDGTPIASNEDLGEPASFQKGDPTLIFGVNETLSLMKEGGSARSIIPSTLGFGSYEYGNAEPYTTLIYDIELVEVKPGIPVEPYNTEGLIMNTTETGLQFYVIEDTDKLKIQTGSLVSVHYTGYLSDGTIFDSSVKRGEPFETFIGVGQVIPGWDEGLLMMSIGDKFRFIIPSGLAYGERGAFPVIPAYETLTFDVEVIDIL